MPTLATQARRRVVKAMLIGYPGSGKTGSLASLANAGYNLRIALFDKLANLDPLFEWVRPENYPNVEFVPFQDKLKAGPGRIVPAGKPQAFDKFLRLLDNWKYTDAQTGEEVDHGPVTTWGPRDILVLDSLTAMGEAAFRRVLHLNNRVEKGPRKNDWGSAMKDQQDAIDILLSNDIPCNVLVTAHLVLIGPEQEEESDSDAEKEYKAKVQQVVPFKLFPSALGNKLPPKIAKDFPAVLLYEAEALGQNAAKRYIRTIPRNDVDVKLPLDGMPTKLDVSDGLLKIFERVHGKGAAQEKAA